MKQTLLIAVFLFQCFMAYTQQLAPISKTVGKLNISVDPRLELLSAVQVISDYPAINRNVPYSSELMKYFGKNNAHQATRLTGQLAGEFGFMYDAPVDFMLHLSQVPELKPIYPYSDRMIERANGKSNLDKYRTALHDFAIESDFAGFWNVKKPFYQKMVDYTASDLSGYDPVGKLESYYNDSKNSYTVTLSPSFAGGYGIRIPSKSNGLDIYGCLNVTEMKEGIPYFSKPGLSHFLWHEFSHSFVNPLTEKYKDRISASSNLYTPLESEMKAMACNNWGNCVNEHIIRAIYIRLLSINENENTAQLQLENEKSLHFAYIEPLIKQLKLFEHERDTKNITFSAWYPTLLNVFDSLSRSDNELLVNPPFLGPIRTVLGSRKIVIIYPTNDPDTSALHSLYNYTANIQKIKGETSILCSDSAALRMDLSDYSIMAYGTIESNLFLSKFKESFPFKITTNAIITNKNHEGTRLRIITCLPNPYNNKMGMLVNTSTSNRNIKGVTNPFSEDFIVFEDIGNILQEGNYQKGEFWSF